MGRKFHAEAFVEALDDFDQPKGLQCFKILLLLDGGIRIIRILGHTGREILDRHNLVLVRQECLDELFKVKPLVRGVAQQPVIQVKPIDIDNSSHHNAPLKR